MKFNYYFIRRKDYTMRSKVTNENTWATESKQRSKNLRRTTRKTESLSKPSKGNTAWERTLRRLESNERERMRMHCMNDAFQVHTKLLLYNTLYLKYKTNRILTNICFWYFLKKSFSNHIRNIYFFHFVKLHFNEFIL